MSVAETITFIVAGVFTLIYFYLVLNEQKTHHQ